MLNTFGCYGEQGRRARARTAALGWSLARMALLAWPLAAPMMAHVTLRPSQPLQPGGFATVNLNVPSERHVGTVSVTLEVPDAFLKAGGRLSRVEYPVGWNVMFEKQNKPSDVFEQEMAERSERDQEAPAGQGSAAKSPEELQEDEIMNELRKQWIKRVTFSGGNIPADGFKIFLLNFQLPEQPGTFRFPATQVYEDGKEVSWSELVDGAERPAPSLAIDPARRPPYLPLAGGGLLLLALGWLLGRARPKRM